MGARKGRGDERPYGYLRDEVTGGEGTMKICKNNHLGGHRNCHCGAATVTVKGPSGDKNYPWEHRLDKKEKRAITQPLREAGVTPVADL